MCRRDQILGIAMLAFGLGMVAAGWIESDFWRWIWSVGLVLAGIMILQKK